MRLFLFLLLIALFGTVDTFDLNKDSNRLLKSLLNYVENSARSNDLVNATLNILEDVDAQACMFSLKREFSTTDDQLERLFECFFNASSPHCSRLEEISTDRSLRLADSWPKLESGFLSKGPFYFLGDYDECGALATVTSGTVTRPLDYCRAHFSLVVGNITVPAVVGVCLPKDCGDYLRKHMMFPLTTKVHSFGGWRDRINFSQGPTGLGWTCSPMGDEAELHVEGPKNIAWIFMLTLIGLVISGTTIDGWRRSQKDHLRYERIADDNLSDSSSITLHSSQSDASSAEFGHNTPSIALTYRSGHEIKRKLANAKVVREIICSFSLRSSIEYLFRNAERDIKCLHGIRILAACWVIVGHSCLFSLFYMDNARMLKNSLSTRTFSSYFLLASPLSVDTFLFVSGAVVAFTHRKRMLFRQGIPKVSMPRRVGRWILFVMHRIFRIYPTIILVSLFTVYVFNALGDGPMWNTDQGVFGTNCTTLADTAPHLLFFGNFAPSFCLPWLWHLSLDMQIQVFAPLLLIGLTHAPLRSLAAAVIAVCITITYRFFASHSFGIHSDVVEAMLAESAFPQSEDLRTMFVWFYGNPLSRAGPFLIGALTGWQVCVRNEKHFKWPALAAFMLGFAFVTPAKEPLLHTIHSTVAPSSWAAGLALVVWMCENGYFRSLQQVLGSHRILPFSRLALGVYITHEPILILLIFTQRRPATPTSLTHFVVLSVTAFSLSLIVAFCLALTVEIPPQTLEKRLFKRREKRLERRPIKDIESREGASLAPVVSAQDKATLWLADDTWAHCVEQAVEAKEDEEISPIFYKDVRKVSYTSGFNRFGATKGEQSCRESPSMFLEERHASGGSDDLEDQSMC